MICIKSPAEGRRSPSLLSRGTCLYPVREHKAFAVSDEKQGEYEELFVQRVNGVLFCSTRELMSLFIYQVWKQRTISAFKNCRVTVRRKKHDPTRIANICSQILNSPIFRLLKGSVYCPTNSFPDVESWSSTAKRTRAKSGTYTSNWKLSFHEGLNPENKERHSLSDVSWLFCISSFSCMSHSNNYFVCFRSVLLNLKRIATFPRMHFGSCPRVSWTRGKRFYSRVQVLRVLFRTGRDGFYQTYRKSESKPKYWCYTGIKINTLHWLGLVQFIVCFKNTEINVKILQMLNYIKM